MKNGSKRKKQKIEEVGILPPSEAEIGELLAEIQNRPLGANNGSKVNSR